MPDSPAERAGLKPGDKVIGVDGEDVTGLAGTLVLRKVLGPAGTKVTLSILRDGVENPFDVEITREKILVPSVIGEMKDDKIAYIQLTTFGDKTSREFRDTLKQLMKNNPKGLILDLRNNGGGLLTTAFDVTSEFVPDGIIMYEQYGNRDLKEFKAEPGGLATKIPMVVLVNEGSASASEIVAGALQDSGRAKLIGQTTFGKGSVQNWIDLENQNGAIRVTVARWLTPLQKQINKIGLTPDVIIEITEEDIKANRDPQLDRAIHLLKEMAE
jgi:carboxyl-terminal processing protease